MLSLCLTAGLASAISATEFCAFRFYAAYSPPQVRISLWFAALSWLVLIGPLKACSRVFLIDSIVSRKIVSLNLNRRVAVCSGNLFGCYCLWLLLSYLGLPPMAVISPMGGLSSDEYVLDPVLLKYAVLGCVPAFLVTCLSLTAINEVVVVVMQLTRKLTLRGALSSILRSFRNHTGLWLKGAALRFALGVIATILVIVPLITLLFTSFQLTSVSRIGVVIKSNGGTPPSFWCACWLTWFALHSIVFTPIWTVVTSLFTVLWLREAFETD